MSTPIQVTFSLIQGGRRQYVTMPWDQRVPVVGEKVRLTFDDRDLRYLTENFTRRVNTQREVTQVEWCAGTSLTEDLPLSVDVLLGDE